MSAREDKDKGEDEPTLEERSTAPIDDYADRATRERTPVTGKDADPDSVPEEPGDGEAPEPPS
ncbi:hypothetical protein [Actinokineospora bangkokensis]|uniref:Uncharacterized protein n=1 Tax=Actinokineospora bangkokensis TaxID=1193682 RepID=A0A1Q9LKX8_9PSEU|nr:hypothetical protein [Actinokineospora bangkokensis]OLR92701.1 hypothetical protein BJP25_22015 [Actinokineospora bangkokensis]